MRTAVGTSLAIVTGTSLLGSLAHLLAGRDLHAGITISMTLACVAGAMGGAALAGRLPPRTLGRDFAILVVAMYLLISVTLLDGPPGAS